MSPALALPRVVGSGFRALEGPSTSQVAEQALGRAVSRLLGSGGEAASIRSAPHFLAGSGSSVVVVETPLVAEEVELSLKLGTIKGAFGVSMSQLANVLRVQRPTVYAWMAPEANIGQVRIAHRDRIEALYQFACQWNRISQLPAMPFIGQVTVGGKDLLFHLSQQNLQPEAIAQLMIALAKRSNAEAERRNAKPSLMATLKTRGFAEAPRRTAGARPRG